MVKRYYTKKELRNMGFSDSDYGQVYETVPPYTKEEKLEILDDFRQKGSPPKTNFIEKFYGKGENQSTVQEN